MALCAAEKFFFVAEFDKTKTATDFQRKFRMKYRKAAPTRKAVYYWYRKFFETGYLCLKQKSGLPDNSARNIERVRELFTFD
ncbi:hypothetical protein X975_25469, partial [Stegodyphus mimosarum]